MQSKYFIFLMNLMSYFRVFLWFQIFGTLYSLSVAINNNCIMLENGLDYFQFFTMYQFLFNGSENVFIWVSVPKALWNLYACFCLLEGFIHVNQVNISLMLIVCLLVLWFRQRSINMANFNWGFSLLLFSSIRFAFVHFEALWNYYVFSLNILF